MGNILQTPGVCEFQWATLTDTQPTRIFAMVAIDSMMVSVQFGPSFFPKRKNLSRREMSQQIWPLCERNKASKKQVETTISEPLFFKIMFWRHLLPINTITQKQLFHNWTRRFCSLLHLLYIPPPSDANKIRVQFTYFFDWVSNSFWAWSMKKDTRQFNQSRL